jgi:hypothetical protein
VVEAKLSRAREGFGCRGSTDNIEHQAT